MAITADQFDYLLQRREELRARHETLCEACNEEHSPFRGDVPGAPNSERDRAFVSLGEVETLIEAALEEERAAGL